MHVAFYGPNLSQARSLRKVVSLATKPYQADRPRRARAIRGRIGLALDCRSGPGPRTARCRARSSSDQTASLALTLHRKPGGVIGRPHFHVHRSAHDADDTQVASSFAPIGIEAKSCSEFRAKALSLLILEPLPEQLPPWQRRTNVWRTLTSPGCRPKRQRSAWPT